MSLYIKVNALVAEHLHLTELRVSTSDGAYLLWEADMLAFAPLYLIYQTAESIGGLVLTPSEAREEQDGTCLRQLPIATDARFIMPTPAASTAPQPVSSDAPDDFENSENSENSETSERSPSTESTETL